MATAEPENAHLEAQGRDGSDEAQVLYVWWIRALFVLLAVGLGILLVVLIADYVRVRSESTAAAHERATEQAQAVAQQMSDIFAGSMATAEDIAGELTLRRPALRSDRDAPRERDWTQTPPSTASRSPSTRAPIRTNTTTTSSISTETRWARSL